MADRAGKILRDLKRQEVRTPVGTDVFLPNYSGVKDAARKDKPSSGATSVTDLALADGNVIVGDAGGVASSVNPSGDVDVSNTGVFSIASGVIIDADVKSDAAIAFSKLASLTSGNILVGSAGNVPTSVNPSGDADVSATGAFTVTDLTIASEAQGDVLYFNGTNWVRLAPGTSGQFLKTLGAAANPAWDTNVSSPWTLLDTDTAAGTVTSISSTIPTGYKVLMVVVNFIKTGSYNGARLRLNGDSGNNYTFEFLGASGATVSGSNTANTSGFLYDNNGHAPGLIIAYIWNKSDETKRVNIVYNTGASIQTVSGVWANSADEITSVDIVAATADTVAIGTRITTYGAV